MGKMIARKNDFWEGFPKIFKFVTNFTVFIVLATLLLGFAALLKLVIGYLF